MEDEAQETRIAEAKSVVLVHGSLLVLDTNNVHHTGSPLGGGFLTGKVTFAPPTGDGLARTRWTGETAMPYYPKTFDKPAMHNALRKLNKTCEAFGISLTEVSLRWLMHHSALGPGDGVILGAKRVEQLESNVQHCRKEPLPGDLIKAVEAMWEEIEGNEVSQF